MSETDKNPDQNKTVAVPTFFRDLHLITPSSAPRTPTDNDPRKLSMKDTSFFDLLFLDKTATSDEIKKTYYRLAVIYHPDKNPDNPEALDKFMQVNRAYSVLIDPTKRQIYEKYGSRGLYVAEKVGEEYVDIYFTITAPWRKTVSFCGSAYSTVAKGPKALKKSVSSSLGYFKRLWSSSNEEVPQDV